MICEICQKYFTLLAHHVERKHKISVRDYKIKYNIPLSKALASDEWVARMREIGNESKSTKKGMETIEKMRAAGKLYQEKIMSKDIPAPASERRFWPQVSQEKVRGIGAKAKAEAALSKLDIVKKEWEAGVQIRKLSVSPSTATKWVRGGLLQPRKKKLSQEGFNKLQEGSRRRIDAAKIKTARQR